MSDLQKHVEHIAAVIENGITLDANDAASYGMEEGDMLSGWDYLDGVLDYETTFNKRGHLVKVSLLVAYGGPNIWVDLFEDGTGEVRGYWYLDKARASIHGDAMGIFDAIEELQACA